MNTAADGIPVEAVRSKIFEKFAVIEFRGPSGGNVQHARAQYLGDVVRSIREKQANLSTVLYVMDSTWRADNRVANYYRLWRQLEREGYRLPVKADSPEYVLHHNQGLKFCGAVMLEDCDIVEADRTLRGRDGCFMLSHQVDTAYLRELVDSHAGGAVSASVALPICMEYVASKGNFCIYPSGGFDDAEVSIYLLGLGESIVGSGLSFSVTSTQH